MKVKIIYNSNIIKKRLSFIKNNISYFKKNKMFFYFPFESIKKISNENINKQIHEDEKHFQIEKIREKLEKKWKRKEKLIFKHLYEYNKKEKKLNFSKEYKCILSFYGCYGYYNLPNEIYVNVNTSIESMMETMVHELIHLLIYKNTTKKSHKIIEKMVDEIFINSGLNKIFTVYR